MIALGLRLRDCPSDEFDWGDLAVIVEHSGIDSHLYRSMHPDEAGWSLMNMLLAAIVDALRWLVWAKTPDGRRNRNRPKPIPRPGVAKPNRTHPKVKAVPVSRMRELLGMDQREAVPDKASRLRKLFQTGKG